MILLTQLFIINIQIRKAGVLHYARGVRPLTKNTSNAVQSRKAGRVSTDEPDFIIVKAGFEYGGDLVLAIVEVKKNCKGLTRLDWDQALQYLRNISHKKPASDLTVYLVTGATTYSVQLPTGEDMEPLRYQFPTLTGLQSSLEGISEHHWAVL
jgi:hypothetical protein